jgi:GH15 family glucan-1,4-alpha-glucosidase
VRSVRRRYRDGTLILETEFETDEGAVTLIDFMPIRTAAPDVVRIVEGKRGRVPMRLELVIRFDYGSIVPWVRHHGEGIRATAGPDTLYCRADAELRGEDLHTVADFTIGEGERKRFVLTWTRTHEDEPPHHDAEDALRETEACGASGPAAARTTAAGGTRSCGR